MEDRGHSISWAFVVGEEGNVLKSLDNGRVDMIARPYRSHALSLFLSRERSLSLSLSLPLCVCVREKECVSVPAAEFPRRQARRATAPYAGMRDSPWPRCAWCMSSPLISAS